MKANRKIESLMGWWREAGVDTLVADQPASWFDAAPKESVRKASESPPTTRPEPDMPGDLQAFHTWLLDEALDDLPQAGRVVPAGDPASGLMVLLDMPEPDDAEEGKLASGEVGQLLDRMLAAIGRDRASIYLATISPVSVPGGTLPDAVHGLLSRSARRHISLAAPRRLLVMGEATCQLLCDNNLADSRGDWQTVSHDGGSVSAIATFHPRFLLRQPALKAESWKDLQLLLEGFDA